MVSGEPVCAASLHFVPLAEEVPRAVIDMLIDGFIRRGKGAIGEVRGPTTEKAVQSHSHFRPRALVARDQQCADFQPLAYPSGRRTNPCAERSLRFAGGRAFARASWNA